MTLNHSTIYIRRLRLYAFHGVAEQEQRVGAQFEVSLRVHYNIKRAAESDNLADTLSYASLCETIRKQMAQPSRLLEHVAGRIAQAIFEEFTGVRAIDVEITKLNPPMGADCDGAGIEAHFTNE